MGGVIENWEEFLENICQRYVEYNIPDGIKMEAHFDVILQNINRIDFPIVLDPKTATFDDVAIHGILRQRLSKSTVVKNIRYAKFMENHKVPVDFRNPTFENFIKHVDYREQYEFKDGKGYSALAHEWKTMQMFLEAYGMPVWNYKPPSFPMYRAKVVPFPEQVNKFLHMKYSNDDYENALIQYLLTHNFIIGWRIPSEPITMKVQDVKIESNNRGYIKITEPKKHYSTRNLNPEEIMTNSRKKSFKNWLDHWRPKVENQYSGDSLYLRPDGKPFESKEQLRMFPNRKASPIIKKIFPEYHNYIARDFCAIARLIRTKLQSNHFDVFEIKEWLGHTQIQTTMSYIKDAKHYYKLAPFDWIHRTLRIIKKNDEDCSMGSKRRKKGLFALNPFERRERA